MRCGAFHRVEGTLCLVRHGQAALSGSKTKAPGFAGGYLLVYNGDLAGRVISVDVDEWSRDDLLKVICAGESLLNVQFPREFKEDLITRALHSVYIVQDCCYKACREHNVAETRDKHFAFPDELDAEKLVRAVSRPFCNGARHQASRCVDRRLAPIGCEVGPVPDRRCA